MSKETVKIIHSAVTAMVVEPSQDMKMFFDAQLSYMVAGHEHMGNSNWSGRSSFFTPSTGKFPAGFVHFMKARLERQGHRVIIKGKPVPNPVGPEKPVVDAFPADSRYAYQDEVVNRLLSRKGMIAQIATGGGKSRVFKLCCERIGRPTLFVTTRKSLMYQMGNNYESSMKKPAGYMGDGLWNPKATGVNFAIIDTLAGRIELKNPAVEAAKLVDMAIEKREEKIAGVLKKAGMPRDPAGWPKEVAEKIADIRAAIINRIPIDTASIKNEAVYRCEQHNAKRAELLELLSRMEFVCLEEAHEVSSNSYYAVMNACKNAHYRLALTATPFMKDDEEANMRLMASTGPVGIKVTEKLLIDLGILAKPYFIYETLKRPDKLFTSTPWAKAQSVGIVDNAERNEKIVGHCVRSKQYGLPTMVLVQQTKHGRNLLKMLEDAGLKALFISGESNQQTRQSSLDALGSGAIDVLIGSTIMDVGVDCPALGMVILAGGGKAEVSLRQRIGRGLRAKKTGPNVAFIIDFEDKYNKHLTKHARTRRAVVEATPGFAENIVKKFNFEDYGLVKL